jgi:hypothetical protein
VRRKAQADLIVGLGGDGTLLEPAVDGDADRLLHDLLHNSSRLNVQSSRCQIRPEDFQVRKTIVNAMSAGDSS